MDGPSNGLSVRGICKLSPPPHPEVNTDKNADIIPRSRTLLYKLTVPHLARKFPASYGTRGVTSPTLKNVVTNLPDYTVSLPCS
jgi:hypothetical protein